MRLNLVDKGFEFFRRNVFDDLGDEFDAVDGFEFVRIVSGLVADEFLFQVENLRLKLFLFFQELDNPVFNVVKPGFQAGADTVQAVFDVLREFFGCGAGYAFQTADAGGNCAFADNVKITDAAGLFDMRTAAKLH